MFLFGSGACYELHLVVDLSCTLLTSVPWHLLSLIGCTVSVQTLPQSMSSLLYSNLTCFVHFCPSLCPLKCKGHVWPHWVYTVMRVMKDQTLRRLVLTPTAVRRYGHFCKENFSFFEPQATGHPRKAASRISSLRIIVLLH